MKGPQMLGLAGLCVAVAGTLGMAQIKSFTLTEMVNTADKAVYAEIVKSRVEKIDSPIDGPDLYFTTLTLEGQNLADGTSVTLDVSFHGGFIGDQGVYNSEAPSADDVKIGNKVVVFSKWADNMGGGFRANAIVAAHGGLFRSADGPSGTTILGRGTGYAVDKNIKLDALTSAVKTIAAQKKK